MAASVQLYELPIYYIRKRNLCARAELFLARGLFGALRPNCACTRLLKLSVLLLSQWPIQTSPSAASLYLEQLRNRHFAGDSGSWQVASGLFSPYFWTTLPVTRIPITTTTPWGIS